MEFYTWLAINGSGSLALIDPTPTALTMDEKIKRLVQFALLAVADTIRAKKKLRRLKEVEIYPAIPKRDIIILAFVARVRQKRIKTSRDIAWDYRDRGRTGTP